MLFRLQNIGVLASAAVTVFAGCSSPQGAESREDSSSVAHLSESAPASLPRQAVDFGRFKTVLGPDQVAEGPLQVVYETERDSDPNAVCPLGLSGTRVVSYKVDDGPAHIVDLQTTGRPSILRGFVDVPHGHHLQFWASTVTVTAAGGNTTTCFDSDGGRNFSFPIVPAATVSPGTVAFATDSFEPFSASPATFRFAGHKGWNVALTAIDGDRHTFSDDVVVSSVALSDPDGTAIPLRTTTTWSGTLPKDGIYTATVRGTAKAGLTPLPRIRFRWLPTITCHEGAHECPNPLRCAKETVQENSPSGRWVCQ